MFPIQHADWDFSGVVVHLTDLSMLRFYDISGKEEVLRRSYTLCNCYLCERVLRRAMSYPPY